MYYSQIEDNRMIEDMDLENGRPAKKWWRRTWQRSAGGKVNKKKTALEKSLKLKKYVQPKNAVMCLNELIPGVLFNVEQESKSPGLPMQVSVMVDGVKYYGFGTNKQNAKQAAAEAALVSFVKPPPPAGCDENFVDTTPWAILASFALYKLFNEWREGRVGVSSFNSNPFGSYMMPQDSMMSQTFQTLLGSSIPGANLNSENKVPNSDTFSAYLGCKAVNGKKEDSKDFPNPAKQVPENAASIHPVMLLHQMRPNLQYEHSSTTKDNVKIFSVKSVIDNHTFVGEGTVVKKAKLELATKANRKLFGVTTNYDGTS